VRRSHHVYKTRVSHHVGDVGDLVEGKAHLRSSVVHVVMPSNECRIGGKAAVVTSDDQIDILDFKVAPGLEETGNAMRYGL
jgi:hypothetical protein